MYFSVCVEQFYAVMCAMYAVFLIGWSVLCCCYCKDLLRVQYWIGAVILIGQSVHCVAVVIAAVLVKI